MESISGYEALKRMRAMRHDDVSYFIMHHKTWNEKRQQTDGVRVVRHCRVRTALPEDSVKPHPDLFLPYSDLDLPKKDRNRMCRKRCIRFVAFPPDYTLLFVDWFTPKSDGSIQKITE